MESDMVLVLHLKYRRRTLATRQLVRNGEETVVAYLRLSN